MGRAPSWSIAGAASLLLLLGGCGGDGGRSDDAGPGVDGALDASADGGELGAPDADVGAPDAGDAGLADADAGAPVDADAPDADLGLDAGAADAGSPGDAARRARLLAYGAVPDPLAGRTVPTPDDPEVALGRALFHTTTLSLGRRTACASCHHPTLAGTSPLSLAVGPSAEDPTVLGLGRVVDPSLDLDPRRDRGPDVPRNTPTVFNASLYDRALGLDGLVYATDAPILPGGAGNAIHTPDVVFGLADPDAGPDLVTAFIAHTLTDRARMRGHGPLAEAPRSVVRDELVARLRGTSPEVADLPRNEWPARFAAVYGSGPGGPTDAVTFPRVASALGRYVASLVFVDTPFHRYLRGDDGALSDAAKRGADRFFTPRARGGSGCASCHGGAKLSDEGLVRAGLGQIGRGLETSRHDPGRGRFLFGEDQRFTFRVPGLLNVARTAPYGHAGTYASLDRLLEAHVDPRAAAPAVHAAIAELPQFGGDPLPYPWAQTLTVEAAERVHGAFPIPGLDAAARAEIVAFLETLTDPCLDDPTCLAPHLATPADDADGAQLVRAAVEPPPRMPPPPLAVEPVPVGLVGHDTRSFLCPLEPPAPMNEPLGFDDVSGASGLDHSHRVSLPRWSSAVSVVELEINAPVAVGDLDGDCAPDLAFAAGDGGGVRLYHNAAGRFVPGVAPTAERGEFVTAVAVLDVDGDGRAELLTGSTGPSHARVFVRGEDGAYAHVAALPTSRSTVAFGAGDLDGDGRVELATAHWERRGRLDEAPLLYRNLGGMQLAPADLFYFDAGIPEASRWAFSPALADLDGDPALDLFLVSDFDHSQVFLQRAGRLVDVTDQGVIREANGMGVALEDVDGDLDLDVFVLSIDLLDGPVPFSGPVPANRLYRNDGGGRFTDVTEQAGVARGGWAWSACALDVDHDGDLDLAQVGGFAVRPAEAVQPLGDVYPGDGIVQFRNDPGRLFVNRGDGTFDDASAAFGVDRIVQGRGLSCVDYDRDGDVDLVASVHSGPPVVLRNRVGTGPGRHALSVRLVGPPGDAAALAARVDVTAEGRVRRRDVLPYGRFGGSDPAELHFGLGGAATADLSVRFRDGAVVTAASVPANRRYVVLHPSLDPLTATSASARLRAAAIAPLAAAALDRADADVDEALALARLLAEGAYTPAHDPAARLAALTLDPTPSIAARAALALRQLDASISLAPHLAALGVADRALAAALVCRSTPLDAGALRALASGGDADAVAALEAARVAATLGCPLPLSERELDALTVRVASIAALGAETLTRARLDALVILFRIGRRDPLPAALLEAVMLGVPADGRLDAVHRLGDAAFAPDAHATASLAEWLARVGRPHRLDFGQLAK